MKDFDTFEKLCKQLYYNEELDFSLPLKRLIYDFCGKDAFDNRDYRRGGKKQKVFKETYLVELKEKSKLTYQDISNKLYEKGISIEGNEIGKKFRRPGSDIPYSKELSEIFCVDEDYIKSGKRDLPMNPNNGLTPITFDRKSVLQPLTIHESYNGLTLEECFNILTEEEQKYIINYAYSLVELLTKLP
ncbi:hypothetical protein Q5O14_17755 [Eubacteriaceae bacterium ES2]|nr:hypothetical protein Q5O14_17755 [Eubacteriaceae bacterium ES2]